MGGTVTEGHNVGYEGSYWRWLQVDIDLLLSSQVGKAALYSSFGWGERKDISGGVGG